MAPSFCGSREPQQCHLFWTRHYPRGQPPIAATTMIPAIPIANISYNNIGSPLR